ncbi:ATP-dependent helicase fft3 [Leucoagaricus sp. SymC.cos]|nr:ATP-dependent helicase fft3 [Leucoagaricus sp. SymC.cos]
MTMPGELPARVRAAWKQSGGNFQKATALMSDPTWSPASSNSHKVERDDVGRVKEVEEATRAQKMAVKEKGKKSMIYANRITLETKVHTTPKNDGMPSVEVSQTPTTPVVPPPRRKRFKPARIDSESEAGDSGEDEREAKRERIVNTHESRALEYLNTTTCEGIQELTGCTAEQANTIIKLRPFTSIEELNMKLGQGRKKAGPAGISPRLFEECTEIFKGYGAVDSTLEECESIGARLRSSIASWNMTSSIAKGKGKMDPLATFGDDAQDGSLSLRTITNFNLQKSQDHLIKQPSILSTDVKLKDYQLLGVNWLNLLYRNDLSCILADEMGLGKTVQVISFLAHLKEKGSKGPHLVVVPSSTLENWCREFARFAPSISIQTYYAGKGERSQLRETLLGTQMCISGRHEGWEVLVTTYTLAQGDERDRKFFRKINWNCCIFDEGHVLKNFQSQRYQSLLKFGSRWRLLLTGTPLQNNLQELVVLLQDLPQKTERIEWCGMTDLQRAIYNETLQRSRRTVLEMDEKDSTTDSSAGTKKSTKTNSKAKEKIYAENSTNVLMDLRKAASHPMLFRRRFTDDVLSSITKQLLKEPDFKKRGALFDLVKEDMSVMTDAELQSTKKFLQDDDCYLEAGKVEILLHLLEKYRSESRKVLIFSQFTQILDILQAIFEYKKIRYLVLTGSTPVDVRQTLVDEFTEDADIPVFLLSTKAGGMGINLTAASVVIMFDQDFNPHNDKQAQDRAYRIGQKRNVEVIKLISRGTIEEDMLKLGQTKLALDEAVAADPDEKGESAPEREMKRSLMTVLRQQFAKQQDEAAAN